jgi:hypothetical protein
MLHSIFCFVFVAMALHFVLLLYGIGEEED